ncbi:unnamed protein product [Tilletia caries]|nr:unnamed protein product [Tilletia caries]
MKGLWLHADELAETQMITGFFVGHQALTEGYVNTCNRSAIPQISLLLQNLDGLHGKGRFDDSIVGPLRIVMLILLLRIAQQTIRVYN